MTLATGRKGVSVQEADMQLLLPLPTTIGGYRDSHTTTCWAARIAVNRRSYRGRKSVKHSLTLTVINVVSTPLLMGSSKLIFKMYYLVGN